MHRYSINKWRNCGETLFNFKLTKYNNSYPNFPFRPKGVRMEKRGPGGLKHRTKNDNKSKPTSSACYTACGE